MQTWLNVVLKSLLFVVLLPGVVISLPQGGSLVQKALVHGVIFAILNHLVYFYVRPLLERFENPDTRINPECPLGYIQCASGDCRLKTDVHSPCS